MSQQQAISVNCHPAAFGQRWNSVVTGARIQIIDNLCQLSQSSTSLNQTLDNIFETSQQESNIMLYVNAFEESGEPLCAYSEMAKAANDYFTNVTFLLVQADEEMDFTEYMTLGKGKSDTTLTLGMLTYEDGQSIRQFPGVHVDIDGTYISIFDVLDENSVKVENKEMFIKMILTRVFSCLSIIGSSYIVLNLAGTRENRKKIQKTLLNRLLLGLSISDIISSISMLVGNWAMPKYPPGSTDEYVVSQAFWDALWPGASGNDASCTAQGFFIHIGVLGSTFFTTFVAVQTLGLVKYNWSRIQMNKVEKVFFGVAIGQPLITGTMAAALGLFNPTNTGFCWINMNPIFCNDKERGPLVDAYCDERLRAGNWFLWHMLFSMSWVYIALIVIAYSMISLYLVVRKQENRVSQSSLTVQDTERQRKILIRGMLYISIYLLIWIPVSLNFLDTEYGEKGNGGGDDEGGGDEDEDGEEEGDFGVLDIFEFFTTCVLPAQGFLNALIYSGVLDKCVKRLCCCRCCQSKTPVAGAASTHYFASSKISGDSKNSGASSRNLVAGGVTDGGALSTSLRKSVQASSEEEIEEGPKPFTKVGNKSVTFDNTTIESKSRVEQPNEEN